MTTTEKNYSVSPADLPGIVERARKAQGPWAVLPYGERALRIKKAARYLASRREEITAVISAGNGKLKIDALAAEVLPALMAVSWYVKQGRRFLRPRRIPPGSPLMFNKRSRLVYRPWGVAGIITPWNYPFAIPFSEVVMALLAGNAVILKAASAAPGVGRALAAIFAAADLPADLFTYVEIGGREAGPAFIAAGVDKLFFTGSTEVGRQLMALAAPRLLPLVLELGGADAAIIRADADLDRAAAGIVWAAFSNAGQSCGGVQRVLVHRAVYPAFLEKLCAQVLALRPGVDLGPLASLKQREAVVKQVEACLERGAKIAAQSPGGGFPPLPPGSAPAGEGAPCFPALVLTEAGPETPIMGEEVFGPVAAVLPVEDDAEAVRLANASKYGLTASVWSRNHRRAKELAAEINAGAVLVNDHLMSHGLAETPWGGFGDSGLGRTHGEAGFREMLRTQVIVDDILPGAKRNLWWQPYSEKVYRGLSAAAAFTAGPGLRRRVAALPALVKIFLRCWGKP